MVAETRIGREAVRQNVLHDDPAVIGADGAGGDHEFALLQRDELRPDEPRRLHPACEADHDHDVDDAGLEDGDHGEHQEDRGDAQHDVHGPHDHAVDPAAVEPRERAEEDADDRCDPDCHESHLKRDPAAPEHAREHVPSEVVGPEGMGKARADENVFDVDGGRVIGRDQRRDNGKNEDEQHEYPADDGEFVLHQIMKCLRYEGFGVVHYRYPGFISYCYAGHAGGYRIPHYFSLTLGSVKA